MDARTKESVIIILVSQSISAIKLTIITEYEVIVSWFDAYQCRFDPRVVMAQRSNAR